MAAQLVLQGVPIGFCRFGLPSGSPSRQLMLGRSTTEAAVYVGAAKSLALALCEAGDLHSAVLSLCMELSRRSETAGSHMEILARAGLDLAISGSRDGVEAWVEGFR